MRIKFGVASLSGRKAALVLAAIVFFSTALFGEDACKSKGGELKVAYPELARRMKISGVVRLQLQLNPSGGVRETKVLGGNPVLVSAAQDAVKQAKFESKDSCVVVFQFKE
jgi:TonB family protein